jgi:uncharacterized protein
MQPFKTWHTGLVLGVTILLAGCAGTHYDTLRSVQNAVQTGEYQRADELLSEKTSFAQGPNRLLYLLNKGTIAHLQGEYRRSNEFFEQAVARIAQLDVTSVTGVASEWMLSSTAQPYGGEDFERVMTHYYMALNYLMLDELDEALVECRRINTLLRELNDRYEQKNVYKTDAFVLYLSGLIYEAMGETNDAFVDYRNAYDTYRTDYQEYYQTPAPSQLRDHLLRTASALGFTDVVAQYRQTESQPTSSTMQPDAQQTARLVVIWNNGLVPYKVEESVRQYIEFDKDKAEEGCYVKFAFPKFVRRPSLYSNAWVTVGDQKAPLQFAEDVAQIAIKNLQDRRGRMLAKAIARNTLKCLAEHELKQEHEWLGWLLAGLTELTEQADTRSWLLLPANISLTTMAVLPGISDIRLSFSDAAGSLVMHHTYEAVSLQAGRTTFLIHRTF